MSRVLLYRYFDITKRIHAIEVGMKGRCVWSEHTQFPHRDAPYIEGPLPIYAWVRSKTTRLGRAHLSRIVEGPFIAMMLTICGGTIKEESVPDWLRTFLSAFGFSLAVLIGGSIAVIPALVIVYVADDNIILAFGGVFLYIALVVAILAVVMEQRA